MSKIRKTEMMLFTGVMLLSCSVKENRTECLCRLEIDLEDFANVSSTITAEIGNRSGILERRTLQLAGESIIRVEIPQQDVSLCIYSIGSHTVRNENLLLIADGHEADSIYVFQEYLNGKGAEQIQTRPVAHKQFAQVTLVAVHTAERTAGATYTVCSDTGALDLSTLKPSQATGLRFQFDLSSGTATFRLPRQCLDSRLTLLMDDGIRPASEFPLGEWILESGYDWTADQLDDMVIDLDFSSGQVFMEAGSGIEAAIQPVEEF